MRHQFIPNEVRIEGDVAYLMITRRKGDPFEAIIDVDDMGKVLSAGRWTSDSRGYLLSNRSRISLHRLVMDAPEGLVVDHLNHVPHDCRKINLRVVPHVTNMQNRKGAHSTSKSGVRGVYWRDDRKKWVVEVNADGVRHNLGAFDDLTEASRIAMDARRKLHN